MDVEVSYPFFTHISHANGEEAEDQGLLVKTPIFGQVMSQDRYLNNLQYLHCVDNSRIVGKDSLFKIRLVVNSFKVTFQNNLYRFQKLLIDESLLLFVYSS